MSRNTVLSKLPSYRQTQRLASSTVRGSGGGGGKFIGYTILTTGAATAGVVGYANYDPKFRKEVEKTVPYSKEVLNFVIGEPEPLAPKLSELRPAGAPPFDANPKKAPIVEVEKTSVKREASPENQRKREPVVKVTVKKSSMNPYLGPDNGKDKNEALTVALKEKLQKAEKSVREATSAKLVTIRAVEHHVQTIREAIEGGPEGDWTKVTAAHADAQKSTEFDVVAEKSARNVVADLLVEVNYGAQGETTVLNPLLAVSRETAHKLMNELDEMVSMIKKVDSEKIFVRDYGHLVEESRKKFALELKAVLPEFTWEEGEKFKKVHLNTLLTHAHLRIDQLSRQLIEQKMREEDTVRKLVDQKKKEHLDKLKQTTTIKQLPDIDKQRFDLELARRLREAQEKYDRKLEEVVKTQKELYDIEHNKDIEKAVGAEREKYNAQIGRALAQLEGIEKALKSHVAMDVANRRSKQMWLAVQNLVDTVEFGRRGSCCMEGRRVPLADQMKILLHAAGEGEEFLKAVDKSMSRVTKVKGEYTKEDLNTRFNKVVRIGQRVAYVDHNGGGLIAHLISWLRSSVTFALPHKYTDKDKINSSAENNFSLLNRAAALWKQGKRTEAIRVLQLTSGATRRVARDFIEDARRHEEALLLTRLLLAHSALTSIRSTY